MELGDIDWRQGRVTVRSKGGWRDPLPLPVDVGAAIAAYLQMRGAQREFPQLFLRVHAPRGPMKLPTVRAVVREACERVGIADVGTHRLRHGAAADLLRNGAGLHEMGPGPPPPRPADDGDVRQGRLRHLGHRGPRLAGERPVNEPSTTPEPLPVSPLAAALADYLAVRRAMGYKLEGAGQILTGFVAHLDATGTVTVTIPDAATWAADTGTGGGVGRRLQCIRGFAFYLQALDPTHEVPPVGLIPVLARRAIPHLYSDADTAALMAAARQLTPPLVAATTETVIGVLAVTGMRIGEILASTSTILTGTAG